MNLETCEYPELYNQASFIRSQLTSINLMFDNNKKNKTNSFMVEETQHYIPYLSSHNLFVPKSVAEKRNKILEIKSGAYRCIGENLTLNLKFLYNPIKYSFIGVEILDMATCNADTKSLAEFLNIDIPEDIREWNDTHLMILKMTT